MCASSLGCPIGDLEDRRAVVLERATERVGQLAAMQADIGDPAPALCVHQRLIGAAALQVVVAHQLHVELFRPVLCLRDQTPRHA
jgi:hypothetical protein